jgi:hypothetical protein
LFDVPSVGEYFRIKGLQLVGALPERLGDDEGPLLGRGELVTVLVALDEP